MKEFLQVWAAILAGLAYFGVAAATVHFAMQFNELLGLALIFLFASPIIAAWVMAMAEAQENRRKMMEKL